MCVHIHNSWGEWTQKYVLNPQKRYIKYPLCIFGNIDDGQWRPRATNPTDISSTKRECTAKPSQEYFYFIGRDTPRRWPLPLMLWLWSVAHIVLLLWQMLSSYNYCPFTMGSVLNVCLSQRDSFVWGDGWWQEGHRPQNHSEVYLAYHHGHASLEPHVVHIICS